jgi:hypothetical protein
MEIQFGDSARKGGATQPRVDPVAAGASLGLRVVVFIVIGGNVLLACAGRNLLGA